MTETTRLVIVVAVQRPSPNMPSEALTKRLRGAGWVASMVGFGFLVFAAALAVEGYNEYRTVCAPKPATGA